jgi:arginine/lysine/ornithine decarboxylase
VPARTSRRSRPAVTSRAAADAASRWLLHTGRDGQAGDATGRVSAELITPYPPGIPAVAPGEVFNEANVAYLEEIVTNGAFVEGARDPSFRRLRVVS